MSITNAVTDIKCFFIGVGHILATCPVPAGSDGWFTISPRRRNAQKWLPVPDNCKNFSSTFSFRRKPLSSREIQCKPKEKKSTRPHPLMLAYRFKERLDRGVVNSKAELARRMGLSRTRVTQALNLLKLPRPIIQFLANCQDPAILGYFTERRLRPLTKLANDAEKTDGFGSMLAEATSNLAVYGER